MKRNNVLDGLFGVCVGDALGVATALNPSPKHGESRLLEKTILSI